MTLTDVMAAKDLTEVSSSALEAALQEICVMANGAAANNMSVPEEFGHLAGAIQAELQRRAASRSPLPTAADGTILCRAVVIPANEYVYPWPHWVTEATTIALVSPDHPFRTPPAATAIRLHGRMTDLDLGTAVAAICAYNELGTDDQDRPLPEAGAVLAEIVAESKLIVHGGLEIVHGERVVLRPGCCCGLEDWREWITFAEGGRAPHPGHEPAPLVLRLPSGMLRIGYAPAFGDAMDVPADELRRALRGLEADLAAFVDSLRVWAERVAPASAAAFVSALDRAFSLTSPTTVPRPGPAAASLFLCLETDDTSLPLRLDPVVLGRSRTADLYIGDSSVARRHAVLWPINGQWVLEDMGSGNGTRVNGRRIAEPTVIAPGDRIQLGEAVLVVFAGERAPLHRKSPPEPKVVIDRRPIQERLEAAAQTWVQHGRRAEDLWIDIKAACAWLWLQSEGGKRTAVSDGATAFVRASYEAMGPAYGKLLAIRDSCSHCGTPWKLESLGLCCTCGAGVCPHCRPALARAANGNQQCPCGGEVVG